MLRGSRRARRKREARLALQAEEAQRVQQETAPTEPEKPKKSKKSRKSRKARKAKKSRELLLLTEDFPTDLTPFKGSPKAEEPGDSSQEPTTPLFEPEEIPTPSSPKPILDP